MDLQSNLYTSFIKITNTISKVVLAELSQSIIYAAEAIYTWKRISSKSLLTHVPTEFLYM